MYISSFKSITYLKSIWTLPLNTSYIKLFYMFTFFFVQSLMWQAPPAPDVNNNKWNYLLHVLPHLKFLFHLREGRMTEASCSNLVPLPSLFSLLIVRYGDTSNIGKHYSGTWSTSHTYFWSQHLERSLERISPPHK